MLMTYRRVPKVCRTSCHPGSIVAPDDEAAARAKAIEYFRIEPAHHFRVVVTKVGRVKTKETA